MAILRFQSKNGIRPRLGHSNLTRNEVLEIGSPNIELTPATRPGADRHGQTVVALANCPLKTVDFFNGRLTEPAALSTV
jgi:hypothetical protein